MYLLRSWRCWTVYKPLFTGFNSTYRLRKRKCLERSSNSPHRHTVHFPTYIFPHTFPHIHFPTYIFPAHTFFTYIHFSTYILCIHTFSHIHFPHTYIFLTYISHIQMYVCDPRYIQTYVCSATNTFFKDVCMYAAQTKKIGCMYDTGLHRSI